MGESSDASTSPGLAFPLGASTRRYGERVKIFISWSGDRSRELAELLAGWIPNVIQTVECFFSSTGIRAGDRWNEEINSQLEVTDFGILCVTPGNIGAPWLNYEAGALAKRVTEKSRVVPITMGFSPDTLPAPLRQFNGVTDNEAGFKSLITSIAETAQSPVNVDEVFSVWWPVVEPKLATLPDPLDEAAPPEPPSTDDVLSEVLGIVQGLQNDVRNIHRSSGHPVSSAEYQEAAMLLATTDTLRRDVADGNRSAIRFLRDKARDREMVNREHARRRDRDEFIKLEKINALRKFTAEDAARELQAEDHIADEDDAVFPGETIK